MRAWLRERRRSRLRGRPFPQEWKEIIERTVPIYRKLDEADRSELSGHIQVFLHEKRFEGGAGLAITDEMRVTIAAFACVLLLHRQTDYYPRLYTIIVYPGAYVAERFAREPFGVVTERTETRLGESSVRGAIVLAWDAVRAAGSNVDGGRNVVLHEFAHQLDAEDGSVEGAPALPDASRYATWAQVLGAEYERLRRDTALGRRTTLDRYGATNPAEFFAVATECFFTQPQRLKADHPRLYGELRNYYQQDPIGL